jgi:hypothetical protein
LFEVLACVILARVVHREVKFHEIIEDFRPDESQLKQVQHTLDVKSAIIRYHSQPLNRFVVFDGKEAMISTPRKSTSEDTSALWTTDSNLIGVLNGYFDMGWRESQELNNQQSTK